MAKKAIVPKMEVNLPQCDWLSTWENMSVNFVDSEAKSKIFEVLNDIFPNNEKLSRHKVRGQTNNKCEMCNDIDTNYHRITNCTKSKEVWIWVENIVKNNLKIQVENSTEVMNMYIAQGNRQLKTALWMVSEVITYNMNHYKNASLFVFKNILRSKRWNQRKFFKRTFGKFGLSF